ncbi:FRG domain-containing protein [Rhodovulum sulfidophilum]|nr:FRG domain-containing protein [Rhodovulum sulfidophilum]
MEARTIVEFFEELSAAELPGGIFRGHSDESWRLAPGLFRDDIPNTPKGNYRNIEDTLVPKFFQLAEAHLNKPEKRNPLRDRIIAQHYGLRTSLPD